MSDDELHRGQAVRADRAKHIGIGHLAGGDGSAESIWFQAADGNFHYFPLDADVVAKLKAHVDRLAMIDNLFAESLS